MAALTTVSLTLFVDKRSNKVVFAEASKVFVDFLFNLLVLPVGTVAKLLKKQGMVGCLSNLYQSVENLSETHLQPDRTKDEILEPGVVLHSWQKDFLLLVLPKSSGCLYRCSCSSSVFFTKYPNVKCKNCGYSMNMKMILLEAAPVSEGGFVKGAATYMVMDDLDVQPMSTISIINLLNKFGVRDVGDLEEKVINLTMEEGVDLLETSLHSKTVLSDVFIKKTGPKLMQENSEI